jgi:hypothetical protein
MSDTYNCKKGEMCSFSGKCVNTVVDDFVMARVSEGCQNLYVSGEVILAGYVGSDKQFMADTQGICTACVDDNFYDGTAQLTFESTLVCEIETAGFMSGQDNYQRSRAAYVGLNYLDFEVYAESTLFPMKSFPYFVRVADSMGNEEVCQVLNATRLWDPTLADWSTDHQMLRLTSSKGTTPQATFVSFGQLYSACTPQSNTIIVRQSPNDPVQSSWTHATDFPTDGPYKIRLADRALLIAMGSPAGSAVYQILTLSSPPDFSFGYSTRLVRKAKRGDTEIYVAPFSWWYEAKAAGLTFPLQFPLSIFDNVDGGYSGGITLLEAIRYDAPTWQCSVDNYNNDDGCHCGCGILDPDCLYPTPKQFAGKLFDTTDPNCLYCSFDPAYTPPTSGPVPYSNLYHPHCTNVKSTYDTIVSPPIAFENYQKIYLSQPLKLDCEQGWIVETPIQVRRLPRLPPSLLPSVSSPIYSYTVIRSHRQLYICILTAYPRAYHKTHMHPYV